MPDNVTNIKMQDKKDIWLKAAVIGSLWGASEIVLGSFLHNLKIPFSGNILTAIGIIIMVSGHRIWPQRGVLFRAGLICAALKSISPSPVIFGPMLAIFMQASLMELAVSAGKRSWPAYLVGGGMAMSYNLIYRIVSSLVLYGLTFVELYQNLVVYLMDQLGLTTTGYWTPLIILLAVFFLTGMVAGAAGIWISREAVNYKGQWNFPDSMPVRAFSSPTNHTRGSLAGPFVMLLLLIAGLYSINVLPVFAAMGLLILFLWFSFIYDKQILQRFIRKKGFWAGMLIMLLLASLLMGDPGYGGYFSYHGFLAGLEMLMRALYVITGFGLISKSIRSSGLIRLFRGKNGSQFYHAVQLAFQTTPLFIQVIPEKREWTNPVRVLTHMVGNMKYSLDYIKKQHLAKWPVFIITGSQGEGKTTFARELACNLNQKNIKTGGVLAVAEYKNGINTSYWAEDIQLGSQKLLIARNNTEENGSGPFVFNEEGLQFGKDVLCESYKTDKLVILDEIGPMEMKGRGWDSTIRQLVNDRQKPMIWVVRESMVEQVLAKYNTEAAFIIHAGHSKPEQAARQIFNYINEQNH